MNQGEFNTFQVSPFPARNLYAAIEIQKNKKDPLPIIASSTLASLSLATQALIDVRLPHGQVEPLFLFMTRAVMPHKTPSTPSTSAASVSWKG